MLTVAFDSQLAGWTMIWTIFYTIGFLLLIMQLKDLPVAVSENLGFFGLFWINVLPTSHYAEAYK